MNYFSDQVFNKVATSDVLVGDYDNCKFIACDLSEVNFSGFKFSECEFIDCNLSLAKLDDTAFRDVTFKDCKMLGLHFEDCNQFGFSIDVKNSVLNHCSFFQMDLRKSRFSEVTFHEADFTEANLSKLFLNECDFSNSIFDRTILDACNMKTAFNFSINPSLNSIKKTKFSTANIIGLLSHLDIIID